MVRKLILGLIFIVVAISRPWTQAASPTNPPASSGAPGISANGKININTADERTLEQLPGVGAKVAAAIIGGRPYKTVAELENVDGIGPARFALLKDRVTTGAREARIGSGPSRLTTIVTNRNGTNLPNREVSVKRAVPTAATGKININTAPKDVLDSLPGIGPVKAQAIIDARPFRTIEDIKKVKGIKEVEFSKIKDRISVQ